MTLQMYSTMRCILISLAAAISIAHTVDARKGLCPNPDTGERAYYERSSEVCCGGNVFPVGRGAPAICCGNRTYSPLDEICCGGEVKLRSSGNECCQFRQWYDPVNELCCGDRVHSRRNGLVKCCASAKYNVRKETCCPAGTDGGYAQGQMTVHPGLGQCCGSTTIDPDRNICCKGVSHERISPFVGCCGNSTYDVRTQACCGNESPYERNSQMCCAGKVNSADNGATCCGQGSYHPSESSCCNDNVFRGIPEVPNVQTCCGGVSYFKTDQLCCEGSLHARGEDLNCCGQDSYNTSSHLCCAFADDMAIHERSSSNEECCGLATYNHETETCCEAASVSFDITGGQCCRTGSDEVEAYDPNQDTCCRGVRGAQLHRGSPTNQSRCCGVDLLSETEMCSAIDEQVIRKNARTDDSICSPITLTNVLSYNSATQICMEDGSIEDRSATVDICGFNLYDPTAEMCCNGFIRGRFDDAGYERECCSLATGSFAPDLQTCCAGNIYDIPTSQSRCCRTKAYDLSTHMCHETGLVRSLVEVALYPELCGNTPYDPEADRCCGEALIGLDQPCCMDFPVSLPEGVNMGECCGFYAFNPNSHICCNGNVHRREGNDSTCCGYDMLTDSERQICCDGSLHWRDGGRDTCDGRTAYNPSTETVCSSKAFPISDGDCCGSQAYDDADTICCNGHLHPRTNVTLGCCNTVVYDMDDANAFCCNGNLNYGEPSLECCGDVTFDPLHRSCCQTDTFSFILPSGPASTQSSLTCCDVDTYQSAHHMCCGGVEHKFVTSGDCCGLDVIRNPDEEICCGGRAMPIVYGKHTECCGGNLIDNRQLTCCNDRIIPLGGSQECCGDTIIDNYFQACCGGESYDRYSDNVGCCSGITYDLATETCDQNTGSLVPHIHEASLQRVLSVCGDEEYEVVTHSCCGNFVYDIRDDVICCNGRPSDISSGKTACCGSTTYNPTRSECCQGVLHDKFDGAECCGASYYQPTKEHCCGDDVIVSRLLGSACPRSTQDLSEEINDDALQCQCSFQSRGQDMSAACVSRLRTKSRILIGIVRDTEGGITEEATRSYTILLTDALRGRLPNITNDVDEAGTTLMVISQDSRCPGRSLRRGQKVVIFMDSGSDPDRTVMRLTRNDVILPFNRKLTRNLRGLLI